MEKTEQSQLKEPELIFESESSYNFIEAAEVLRQANIYFEAEEEYTGEFRPSRRAPPPYIWRIYVSKSNYDAANSVLSQNSVIQYHLEIPETSDADSENSNKAFYAFLLAVLFITTVFWLYKVLIQ